MPHHVIEFDQKCKSCKGTGLYIGYAEKDGAAVVCCDCRGTGCRHTKIEYDDFEERIARDDVERVYEINPGIGIGKGKASGEYKLSDFGGISYEVWVKGHRKFGPGTENRRFTCPAWWYQTADYEKKPDWADCVGFGSFSGCDHFANKEDCWDRWDKEFLLGEEHEDKA